MLQHTFCQTKSPPEGCWNNYILAKLNSPSQVPVKEKFPQIKRTHGIPTGPWIESVVGTSYTVGDNKLLRNAIAFFLLEKFWL